MHGGHWQAVHPEDFWVHGLDAHRFLQPASLVQGNAMDITQTASTSDATLDAVRRAAADVFRQRLLRQLPHDRRANYLGISLLAASFIAFSVAIALQIWVPS